MPNNLVEALSSTDLAKTVGKTKPHADSEPRGQRKEAGADSEPQGRRKEECTDNKPRATIISTNLAE